MESLSPEVMNLIILFLKTPETRLARFAQISRQWQELIEQHTFSKIRIVSPDFAEFKRALSNNRRRVALTRIEFEIVLPPYPDSTRAHDEHAGEDADEEALCEDRNSLFTDIVCDFLDTLRSWETEYPRLKTATCLSIQFVATLAGENDWIIRHQFADSLLRLNLTGSQKLSEIERVVNLYTIDNTPWQVDGASMLRIAGAFCKLEKLSLALYDNEKRDMENRRQQRYAMANQLDALHIDSLRVISFTIVQTPTLDEEFPIQSVLKQDEPSTDHFSLSIHRLSHAPQLESLYIEGFALISQSIFYPISPSSTISEPWLNLQRVSVSFDMKTPTGEWYFLPSDKRYRAHGDEESEEDDEHDEEEDDDEEDDEEDDDDDEVDEEDLHEFELAAHYRELSGRRVGDFPEKAIRNTPDASQIYPIFRAASLAAAQMPKLRSFCVTTRFADANRRYCEMWYEGPGVRILPDYRTWSKTQSLEDIERHWRLYWCVTGLDPDKEILDIWTARESKRGRELTIHIQT